MTLPAIIEQEDRRDPTESNTITSGKGTEAMIEPFHKMFPEVAERESRFVHIQNHGEGAEVPAGEYCFIESYCTNPDC